MKENRLDNEKLLKIIINNYKKIFNTFFKYSIFIIIFLISIFSVSKNLNTKVSLDINDDFIVEKIKLI
jgi:biotin-(acetyl-CoA carboxylase) ligase